MNAKTVSKILMIAGVAMFAAGGATLVAFSNESERVAMFKLLSHLHEAFGHIDPKRLQ